MATVVSHALGRRAAPLFDDLERRKMEYTVSVPFTRFADLKAAV